MKDNLKAILSTEKERKHTGMVTAIKVSSSKE